MAKKKLSREEFERTLAEREESIRELRERIARMKTEQKASRQVGVSHRRRLFGLL